MATIGSASQENFIGLVNLFSGGAVLQQSIFALGVMPYITASIVVQLLRVVIPRFEALHKEGQSGEAKLTQYTRYLTIGLAVLQSTTILVTARSGALFNYQCDQVIPDGSVFNLVVMVLIMTGGTGLIMWMAELVTDKGIGQGMSILIFMSICSGFLPQLWEIGYGTDGTDGDWLKFGIVVGVLVVILIFVDFVELCQRRVPVQYTRRMIGRKMYGGSSTYLPLKINMSGVIPPIFASSILAIPTLIAQFGKSDQSWVKWINANLANTTSVWYIALYALMIVFFCFFYTSITFNPDETADNMKQYGGKCPVIVIGGDAGNFLGEYMAGGIIVLMGRAGDHLASGMHGGVIYLRREYAPAVVPDGLDAGELTDDDSATLGALLARYDACFGTEPHEQASVDEFVALRPASSRPYAAMYAS